MADKTISDLTQAESIGSEDLFVLEQGGEAKKLKGARLVKYAQDTVGAQVTVATEAAESAETAKTGAESAQTQAQAARDAILNMIVEAITLESGLPATVDKSIVDSVYKLTFGLPKGEKGAKGDTGAGDMLAATYDPQGKAQDIFAYADGKASTAESNAKAYTYSKSEIDSKVAGAGKVKTVNSKSPDSSGNIALNASDVGARPSTWTPTKGDIGLGNVDNVKQYSASNPPPYPVTSVNGKTGVVTVDVPTVPSTTNILKGDGSGGLVAATRGSDYIASGNIVKQTLVATETTPTENYAINWVYS